MPKIDFSNMKIASLKPGEKTVEYFDLARKHGDGAFGLRVSPLGKCTWFIMYKTESGAIKRFSLGVYPELSLKDARKKATTISSGIHAGVDPMQRKKIRRAAPTVTELWEEYTAAEDRKTDKKAKTTRKEEQRQWFKTIMPAIGRMKVEDVRPVDLSDMLNEVADKAPVSGNRLHSLLQVMFKPALAQGWITVHPLHWIDKPGGSEKPRRRVLTDDEIRVLWPYFDTLRPNPRDTLKLGLLTAQRPGEILSMKWADVDLDAGVWTLRGTKVGNDHLVPISPQVKTILENRKNGVGYSDKQLWMKDSEYIFPSRYNVEKGATSGHATSTKEARKKLQGKSGITGWTAHDLRRTARTIMSRLKIKHRIRERVLNHSQGGVSGVYDLFDYLQEKSDALNKLANEIDRIIGIEKTTAKIIKLQRTG